MPELSKPSVEGGVPQAAGQAQASPSIPAAGPSPESSPAARLAWCFGAGIRTGLRMAGRLLMIMAPVSLVVKILGWSGILVRIRPFAAVMRALESG